MGMMDILKSLVAFPLISVMMITGFVIIIGITNDGILFPLENVTIAMGTAGTISAASAATPSAWLGNYASILGIIDFLWLGFFLFFLLVSVKYAYEAETIELFSFLGLMFFLSMVLLYLVSIYWDIATWFMTEVLANMMPNIAAVLPLFDYYLAHVGYFAIAQIVLILVVNQFDLDFAKGFQRKKKEQSVLMDNEVL